MHAPILPAYSRANFVGDDDRKTWSCFQTRKRLDLVDRKGLR